MMREYKASLMLGNVVDLALGVIIGGAFGKVISSLVIDIFLPIISELNGGMKFSDLKIILFKIGGVSGAEVSFLYGMYIKSILDFLIIAFSIFAFIKLLRSLKKKKAEKIALEPLVDSKVKLLSDNREDLSNK
jgi:large conductance mechanosensitive channel